MKTKLRGLGILAATLIGGGAIAIADEGTPPVKVLYVNTDTGQIAQKSDDGQMIEVDASTVHLQAVPTTDSESLIARGGGHGGGGGGRGGFGGGRGGFGGGRGGFGGGWRGGGWRHGGWGGGWAPAYPCDYPYYYNYPYCYNY